MSPPAATDEDAKQDGDAKADESDDEAGGKNDDEKEQQGIAVRMVYAGSPAAEAGIQAGDRVVRINETGIASIDDAITELNNVAPGGAVAVRVLRADESKEFKLTAVQLPTSVPEQLPPAYELAEPSKQADAAAAEPPAAPEGKSRKLKLAEFKQSCQVYLPASHAAGRPLGMLLWLHAPGDADAKEIIRTWQPICDRDGLLLVVPTAADDSRWERTELEYLRRLTERAIRQYKPDPHRVVVFGQGGGGAMAWLLGLSSRDILRGVATSAAPLPRQVRVPENEPAERLAIFAGLSAEDATVARMAQGLQELSDAGYPVSTITTVDRAGQLSDAEREELARWIDTLDRF